MKNAGWLSRILRGTIAVVVCGLLACSHENERPDIVLLSVDTVGADALAELADLPAFERLAQESARFDRAYSPSSWTLPAHASLMTGLYPDRNGATDLRRQIKQGSKTLAQALSSHGYETIAFTDAGFVDASYGFRRGFISYDQHPGDPELPRGGRPNEIRGATLFDRAIAFLDQRDSPAPLFLFLHSYAVHDYFAGHDWTRDVLLADPAPKEVSMACLLGRRTCSADAWEDLRALYEAELVHMDEGLARLRQSLGRRVGRPTIFLLVSDHGEGLDPELGAVHHGGNLDPALLHVPFWIAGPGIPASRIDAPVSLIDVFPTVLELVGAPHEDGLEGVSLAPRLRGEPVADRVLYAMDHLYHWPEGVRENAETPLNHPRAIAAIDRTGVWVRDADGRERYFAVDANVTSPSSAPAGPHVAELARRATERARIAAPGEEIQVSPDLQKQLRSLGYAD